MIPALRQQTILDLLHDSGSLLYIDDLQKHLNISSSTLRRDLRELENKKQVRLLHGGGVQLQAAVGELNIMSKLTLNMKAKDLIAAYAASLIEDEDVIFLDPSSTTLQMIPHLINRPVTVVTNGIFHINQLVSNSIPSVMLGGNIRHATTSCIGPWAENMLRSFHFNKCFLGSNGFSIKAGITNHDINECTVKQLAMENSQSTYFLMDSSKYDVTTMVKVVDLNVPTIITDKAIPQLKDYSNILVAGE